MSLQYSPNHTRVTIPIGYYSQQQDPVSCRYPSCLKAITAAAILVKATKKITVEFPLTIFVPHAVEALLNLHHTQHFCQLPHL